MREPTREELEARIAELEAENDRLRAGSLAGPRGPTVRVPEKFAGLFQAAQETVSDYFSQAHVAPERGTIEVGGDRYVLIRASALSHGFLNAILDLYADRGSEEALHVGRNLLFDLAHVVGMNDARNFHERMGLTDPVAKLSAGPVHFAFAGWAFVDILPESSPTPDEDYCLIYHHPFSFESDSWLRAGERTDVPVCIMNSGYSSGWCEESFGLPLTAVEIACKARGDDNCTFIMAPPHRVKEHVERVLRDAAADVGRQASIEIPTFFERKKNEERIREAYRRAEAASRAKTQFLANMSHEIRTPLNGILGLTRLLRESNLDQEQRQFVDTIGHSGSTLLTILDDILDISRIEAGKLATFSGPCDVRKIFSEVKDVLQLRAAEKQLEFSMRVASDVPEFVVSDAVRLRQIVLNLVGNAVKFTDRGVVEATADWEVLSGSSGMLLVRVRDTGIGIAEEDKERLFDQFSQADPSNTRRYGGTGLGLSICRQLIGLLGGELGVESVLGEGSTFWFRLPSEVSIVEGESEEGAAGPAGDPVALNGHVLVVEDNRVNQLVAEKLLQRLGCAVDVVVDGRGALEAVGGGGYDLVLMDCQMPEMDGFEATRRIRAQEKAEPGGRVPIIAMTASVMPGDAERCLASGMDGFLSKPLDLDGVREVLKNWLG